MLSTIPLLLSLILLPFLFVGRIAAATVHPPSVSKTRGPESYAITGLHTGVNSQSGARPARRNILDLQNDVPAWSLYIQALTSMQNENETSQLSYFQIAGIHGRPFISWDNVGSTSVSGWGGYCTHSSVLFPSWHRPYLALFEQVLSSHAQSIAKQFSGELRQTYQTAADNLRVPYWDWASFPQVPDSVAQKQITITTPFGTQTVTNPLYQYRFQQFPFNPDIFPSNTFIAADAQTARAPDTPNGESDHNAVNSVLAQGNFAGRAWYALVKSSAYDAFATSAVAGPSVESVHNSIHGDVGQNYGHMSFLEYSAFDPIFWLHHCNVDRLFAMWQATNPNVSLTPLSEPGTFTLPQGSLDTLSTSLTPFTSNSHGQFYNSNTARSMKSFGYTYPEIEDWHQSPTDLKNNVTAQINKMYDPNGIFQQNPQQAAIAPRSTLTAGSATIEWSVGIQVAKFDLDGAYFVVRVFLGEIPVNPQDWAKSPTCVASVPIMPPPHQDEGPYPDTRVHDEFDLTKAIVGAKHNPEDVQSTVPYLKSNLSWRVQLLNGTVVPTEQLPSLRISVQDEEVTMAKAIYELPTYGKKTMHPEITKDKTGGDKGGAAGR
ncbi:hypothetical protein G7Y89_g2127 [Cudoniella acicularis]|uniref:Tyrosinase copper-binding domain-containing protein n=1 Tax=Cudoniella acicularis TaxID=354080 RepID=A0A8H4RVR8_9HELO|nr:hypothetical protein G7Y89_g2127 [Cudoniella acicularis]